MSEQARGVTCGEEVEQVVVRQGLGLGLGVIYIMSEQARGVTCGEEVEQIFF